MAGAKRVCGAGVRFAATGEDVGRHEAVGDGEHLWEPEYDDAYVAANSELKERFAWWAADSGVEADPDAVETPIHYSAITLTVISPGDAAEPPDSRAP